MAFEVTWLIPDEVVLTRNWGKGSESEIRETIIQTAALINSSPRPLVHVLSDSREVTQTPSLAATARVMREVKIPDRAGWLVNVQVNNPVTRFLIDVTTQFLGRRYRNVPTMDEAIAFLKSVDDTVAWDKLPETFKVNG